MGDMIRPFSRLLLLGLFCLPAIAFAQGAIESVGIAAGFGSGDLPSIIGGIIKIILTLLGVVFLGLMIYAGFGWMTAGGDDKKVEKSKKTIISATVGLVLMLLAYAITTFIVNLLGGAFGNGSGNGNNGSVVTERLSGSLGSGPISDHYPARNASDIARNTKIIVTFKDPIDPESFIAGYDNAGTPSDLSDDIVASSIDSSVIKIYPTATGESDALTNVTVSFTDDLKTYVFDPIDYLGSASEPVSYTVVLEPGVQDVDGSGIFSGSYSGGYEWSFETGTNLDVTPPTVESVIPVSGGTYARNIAVQITFDEAVDPTSATGTADLSGTGFSNISLSGAVGEYQISNGYQTVTFVPSETCGTNSCGDTLYCLAGDSSYSANVKSATVGLNPPQTDTFPYDGVVDVTGNSLDGNNDGTAGDDYSWNFSTNNEIELDGPSIESVSPNIGEENVDLDRDVLVIFDDVLMSSTVNGDSISFTNSETTSGSTHEMWYRFTSDFLSSAGEVVSTRTGVAAKTAVTVSHGTFLQSIDGKVYLYGLNIDESLKNQYQNCYAPAAGPDAFGGQCAVSEANPYCCNGTAQSTACSLF